MNREQRRAARFKRGMRHDRNAMVDPTAALRPVAWSRTYDAEEAARLSTEARMAWHRLITGDGSEHDFDLLAGHLNTGAVMAADIEESLHETASRAQQALADMQARYRRTGRFGADAQALQTVPDALDVYDEILRNSTPLMMVSALDRAADALRRGCVIEGANAELRGDAPQAQRPA